MSHRQWKQPEQNKHTSIEVHGHPINEMPSNESIRNPAGTGDLESKAAKHQRSDASGWFATSSSHGTRTG